MAKKKVMNECIEELVKAIILQAVEDYRNALMVLNWYQGQKQKEKARRIELRKIRKQAKKPGETPEQGEADAGQTSRPMKPMGKEARRKAERKRKQAGEKRRKREELVRAARRRKREVERFFHSSWFSMMSDTDPEEILREARAIEKDGAIPEGTGIPGAGTKGGQPGGEAGDADGEPAGTGYGYGEPSERGDSGKADGDRIGRITAEIADTERQITAAKEEAERIRLEVRETVSQIREPMCQKVIMMHYLEYRTLQEIAEEICYSRTQTFRLLETGREEIERMLANE